MPERFKNFALLWLVKFINLYTYTVTGYYINRNYTATDYYINRNYIVTGYWQVLYCGAWNGGEKWTGKDEKGNSHVLF